MSKGGPVRAVRRLEGGAIVVDVAGDVDLQTSPRFQQALLAAADEGPMMLVVNLTDVRFMDSSGVASLVKLLSRCRRNGVWLGLAGMSERVRSIFEITHLTQIFNIFLTEQEALRAR